MSVATPEHDLATLREQAAQRFEQLGWPTMQWEEWRYTNVAPIAKATWRVAEVDGALAIASVNSGLLKDASAELVFVNGHYVHGNLGATGVQVVPMSQAEGNDAIERHYARYADYQRHPFTALNTANAQDGGVIVVQDGAVVEGFIHLLFVGEGDGVWSHPRNLIVVGRNAQVRIVESYVGSGSYFTNAVTEIVAGEGAVVDHYKIECESLQAYHVATTQIHQERSSSVTSHHVTVGGTLVRNEVNAALAGEGASLTLDGLFVLTNRQHADNHTVIDHVRPHCDSLELYKGILNDEARGIFDGRIIVREGAQKTNSRQYNHNLLLSPTAIVDSKPTLEILNDDVKCNHGSTIGQLNEEALFYLRARGIEETEARQLLIYAFATEIVDRMKVDAVRDQVGRVMFQQMSDRLPDRRTEART
jgi:Fe-S cluster assembly protein SufD